MLVEFRVKNFRSFRDEQVLSLVASKDKTLLDTHTLATGWKATPNLVKSAVIYGANASGKSNLIKALQCMREKVVSSVSSTLSGLATDVQPFRLNTESDKQPSEFEVTFIVEGIRYQYGFATTPQRIVREYLLVYKAFKPQRWFERRFDEVKGKDVYEFGSGLKGQKSAWEEITSPNRLFMPVARLFNSEALRPVYDWFASSLVIFSEESPLNPRFTVQMLKQDEGRKRICNLFTAAGISIADIEVITQKEEDRLRFFHVTDAGEAVFDLADESSGTRNLLFASGPVLDVLSKGLTLVVDELDTSMHTNLVRALVRLFHRPDINTGGAQLIFTTHDTSLLDAYGLFRRDQIWFVEKQADQSSTLYSLLDYSPRKNEALERGYLQGRYGAVPILSGLFGAPL
jgi:AAA15 family ATPase/GTPase